MAELVGVLHDAGAGPWVCLSQITDHRYVTEYVRPKHDQARALPLISIMDS